MLSQELIQGKLNLKKKSLKEETINDVSSEAVREIFLLMTKMLDFTHWIILGWPQDCEFSLLYIFL